MKNAYAVLEQKETDLARVRQEIESLRTVAPLLSDQLSSEELEMTAYERETFSLIDQRR